MENKFIVRICILAVGLAVAALGPVGLACADTINASPTGITSPTQTITFEEIALAADSSLTNQYAALGVTFSPNVYYSPQTGFGNVQGNDIGNFTLPTRPAFVNPVTMLFSTPQTAVAFSFQADITPYLFEALLGGVVVDSFSATVGFGSTNDFYGFSNDVFDSLRITQTGEGGGPYWVADNIQFGTPAAVSEPANLVMLGLGLITVGAIYRRRKALA